MVSRANDIEAARDAMVNDLVARRVVCTPAIEQAFRRVPRHEFLPAPYLLSVDPLLAEIEETHDPVRVYSDLAVALTTDKRVCCCAPSMAAAQIERLSPADGMRLLHIGIGSGYVTAILAELTGERGTVVGIEHAADLADLSARLFAQAGYTIVTIRQGDGMQGVPEAAPFDAILVSGGVTDIAAAWVAQLGDPGTLVLPLCPAGPRASHIGGGALLTVRKSGQTLWGRLSPRALFVPLHAALTPSPADNECLADGLRRWFALEDFLRVDLPIRIALKPLRTRPPDARSVPWLLETRNAVMWIAPS